MITKYRCYSWGAIQEVEILKETDHFVWLQNGRREGKNSGQRYFDSIEDAWAYKISSAEERVKRCEGALEYAKKELEKVESEKQAATA